jgi:KUP system potassium uptake protein
MSDQQRQPEEDSPFSKSLGGLAVGALGVVFGDIATSPLYTFQQCLEGPGSGPLSQEKVWGVLSLIFWSLMVIVSFKYVTLLMSADNQGEGGIMALLAQAPSRQRRVVHGRIGRISIMVMAGAALMFGDGIITPAISVLSALEGLTSVNDGFEPWIVPGTVAILVWLFCMQRRGTGTLGKLFGPVMALWLITIAVLGLRSILAEPRVLWGLSPYQGILLLLHGGLSGFKLLGSVVMAVTGGEALYADMAHFGRTPIRAAWFGLALPALVLCYFGQGSAMLRHPEEAQVPFFSLVSGPVARTLLIVLATLATIIASQGLISAVFSLSHQAIRLGYLPRMRVLHTSESMAGRIYIPFANVLLGTTCIALVLAFRGSTALGAAFGLAVSGTMLLTSLIFYQVLIHRWRWSRLKAGLLVAGLLVFEVPFLGATMLKVPHGGYIPLLTGAVLLAIMTIWTRGRSLLAEHYGRQLAPLDSLPERIEELEARRIPGIGIYLTSDLGRVPKVMEAQLRYLRSVFETIVLLEIEILDVPYARDRERIAWALAVDGQVHTLTLSYGFIQAMTVPADVATFREQAGLGPALVQTYLSAREEFVCRDEGRLSAWQEAVFAFLSRNALDVASAFDLPPKQVLEVSHRLDL